VLNLNDLDGYGSGIIKILSWHLPGGTEKYSFRISDVVADFPNWRFLNKSLECGQNTSLVGQLWSDEDKKTYIMSSLNIILVNMRLNERY